MIVDIQELKRMFGIEDTNMDDILHACAVAAEQEALTFCGTALISTVVTEHIDGDGSCEIILKNSHIIDVASVYDDLERDFPAGTLIPASDYVFDEWGKISLINLVTTIGKKNIQVTYTAGYSIVPQDMKQAITNIAAARFIEDNAGIAAVQAQDFVYRPKKLRDNADSILERYRRIA